MSFTRKGTFVVDHTKVPSTQTNFEVLVSITHNDLKTIGNGGYVANSNGYDIRAYSNAGLSSAISYDLDYYDGVNGRLDMWVKISSLSSSSDTTFYLGFGDAALNTNGSSTSTWKSTRKEVLHFGDGSSLVLTDSTSNTHNATNNNAVTAAAGKVGGAASFNGNSNNYLTTGYTPTGPEVTFSAWIHKDGTNGSDEEHVIDANPVQIWVRNDGTVRFYSGSVYTGTEPVIPLSTWKLVHFVGTTTGHFIYVDGILASEGGNTNTLNTITGNATIGEYYGTGPYTWNGLIDEFRITEESLSADWITVEYNNQSNPSSGGFYTSITFATFSSGSSLSATGVAALSLITKATKRSSFASSGVGVGTFSSPSSGSNIYLAQTNLGTGNGTSAGNARIYTWFNDIANWGVGAGKIGPGTIIHLCGTINPGHNTKALEFMGSGTPGNVIKLLWEANAVLEATALPSLGGIQGESVNYIEIDGGSNGIIRNTDNGSDRTYHIGSHPIRLNRTVGSPIATNITVKNLHILDIYHRTSEVLDIANNNEADDTDAISISGTSNVTITNITHTFSRNGLSVGSSGFDISNCDISFNNITNCCHFITVSADAIFTNCKIHDNDIGGGGNYWAQQDNHFHMNPIMCFTNNNPGDHFNDLWLYDNYIHGQWGSSVDHNIGFGCVTSSFAFLEWINPQIGHPTLVFNNLVVALQSGSGDSVYNSMGNGMLQLGNGGASPEVGYVYNNTFIGANDGHYSGVAISGDTGGIVAKNNIVTHMGAFSGVTTISGSSFNCYFDCGVVGQYIQEGIYPNSTAWHAAYSIDIFTDPGLNGLYAPISSGSSVYHTGTNLSGLGITALNVSRNSITRGTTWTIGSDDLLPAGSSGVLSSNGIGTVNFSFRATKKGSIISSGLGVVNFIGSSSGLVSSRLISSGKGLAHFVSSESIITRVPIVLPELTQVSQDFDLENYIRRYTNDRDDISNIEDNILEE